MVVSSFPKWLEEPAKLVGWVVAAAIAVAAGVVALLNEVGVLLPAGWQDEVRAALAVATTVGLIASRVQALLTRNGAIGRVSVGGEAFEGVFSPATVQRAGAPAPCAVPPSLGVDEPRGS